MFMAEDNKRRRRKRTRDPEGTKAKILSAATALFTQRGPNGASLDDISKKAGVNRGLIYHYFRTKDALLDHVLAKPLAAYVQTQLELLQRDVDAASLRQSVESFFYFLADHPEIVRLLAWTLAMRRLAAELSQLELTRALFAAAVRRIDEARAAGRIRAQVDPAHLLITIIDLCVAWHMGREEWVRKMDWDDRRIAEVDRERLAAIVDFVGAAVRPLPAPTSTGGDET